MRVKRRSFHLASDRTQCLSPSTQIVGGGSVEPQRHGATDLMQAVVQLVEIDHQTILQHYAACGGVFFGGGATGRR
jgi:hypothetical protein